MFRVFTFAVLPLAVAVAFGTLRPASRAGASATDAPVSPTSARATQPIPSPSPLPVGRSAPAWRNTAWLNASAPVTLASLKGRVVLLNFWVFTCGNCQRTVPSLTTLDAKYRSQGLTILGIHTPEFPPYAGEHDRGNVQKALVRHGIQYPVAQDNDEATWNLYGIKYWPSLVLIDKQGNIRYEDYGEFHVGDATHRQWEQRIAALLAE